MENLLEFTDLASWWTQCEHQKRNPVLDQDLWLSPGICTWVLLVAIERLSGNVHLHFFSVLGITWHQPHFWETLPNVQILTHYSVLRIHSLHFNNYGFWLASWGGKKERRHVKSPLSRKGSVSSVLNCRKGISCGCKDRVSFLHYWEGLTRRNWSTIPHKEVLEKCSRNLHSGLLLVEHLRTQVKGNKEKWNPTLSSDWCCYCKDSVLLKVVHNAHWGGF